MEGFYNFYRQLTINSKDTMNAEHLIESRSSNKLIKQDRSNASIYINISLDIPMSLHKSNTYSLDVQMQITRILNIHLDSDIVIHIVDGKVPM